MTYAKSIERDVGELDGPKSAVTRDIAAFPLAVAAAGKSDCGLVRANNEDQFRVVDLANFLRIDRDTWSQVRTTTPVLEGHLLLVADGMGGHAGGEVASRLTVRTVEECLRDSLGWLFRSRIVHVEEAIAQLRRAVLEADARVMRAAQRQPELAGLGSTLTLALVVGRSVFIAHVGDSRAYLLRQGVLRQLTRDHTLINHLAASGKLLPGQDVAPWLRHVITNSVGGSDAGVRVESARATLEPGDRLLLCTDGLTDPD
jgi:PPM family protein phosphatase